MKTSILVLGLAMAHSSLADGLPKDEQDRLTVPHTLVTLSPSQVEEMEALDSVTLTREQWAGLRKVSPNTPKRIEGLLPITWNDCLCCAGPVGGVLMKDGKLAIWHESQDAKLLARRIGHSQKLSFKIDHRGQFHLDGVLVRYNLLLEAIRASDPVKVVKGAPYEHGQAAVEVPPAMQATDPVFKDRILTVYRDLAAKGWNGRRMPYPFHEEAL